MTDHSDNGGATGSSRDDELLVSVGQVASEILVELRQIRGELANRPTRAEQTISRRASFFLLLIIGFTALMVNDAHVSSCSPGARTNSAVEYLAHTPPDDFQMSEVRNLLSADLPVACDITYPTEAHSVDDEWPTDANLLGIGIYSTLAAGMVIWYRWPMRDQGVRVIVTGGPPVRTPTSRRR